jgi:galactonate dehydratase
MIAGFAPDPVRHARLSLARVSDRTIWAFVEIVCGSGAEGVGEASLAGRERALVDAALDHLPRWLAGAPPPVTTPPPPLALAALATAFDVARCDAAARRAGLSLVDALGGAGAAAIPLYANVNRRTRDRSPGGFAASARHAVGRGFDAVKIAPFDEIGPAMRDDATGHAALRHGLARIAAVRESVGPEVRLMVDCHWRFGETLALRLVEAVRPFGLHWLECPVVETPAAIPLLASLRRSLNAAGVRLAGLEEFTGAEAFLAFAEGGAYDVMMPDMKYVGGFAEMARTAAALAAKGVEVSPHNPTGPICHAASLHACAALPGFTMLEMQLDETPRFATLTTQPPPGVDGGVSALPAGPGLGLALDRRALDPLVALDLAFRR